jgi:hypothetical protein
MKADVIYEIHDPSADFEGWYFCPGFSTAQFGKSEHP